MISSLLYLFISVIIWVLLATISSIYQVSLGNINSTVASHINIQRSFWTLTVLFWFSFIWPHSKLAAPRLEDCQVNFNALFSIDFFSLHALGLVILSTLLIMKLARTYILRIGKDNLELGILFLFTILFIGFLLSSFDFMSAFISLEGLSFTLYVLAALNLRSQASIEAAIKYFCLGGVSSGIMLFGISLLYGLCGSLNFAIVRIFLKDNIVTSHNYNISDKKVQIYISLILFCIIFGFLFKLSAFPCHIWTPDVYEGSPLIITAFFATVIKLAIYFFFIKLLNFVLCHGFPLFKPLLICSAVGSLVVGCFGALVQKKIKRFIAYTSINQMGFLLLGFSYNTINGFSATVLHMIIYLVMSFGLFSFLLGIINESNKESITYISDLRYLGKRLPLISLYVTIILFSMAGIPPLGGFFGKYSILLAGVEANHNSLVIIALFINIISTFYYIRLVKKIWFGSNKNKNSPFAYSYYETNPSFFNFFKDKNFNNKTSIYYRTLTSSVILILSSPFIIETYWDGWFNL